MYSSVKEDNLRASELVAMKEEIKLAMAELDKERDYINSKFAKLGKKLSKINFELKTVCEHEWTREPHLYSELYCKKCGVWK
tara:strand:- start:2728 stop:2973 length:246 start_codon:yes stop_codon:yes gene_type:complete